MTDHDTRRSRLLIQVLARWTGIDFNDDEEANRKATEAADATFRPGINDLDWQAATLRQLGYKGLVL